MKYKYVAMNARSQKKEGTIEAESQSDAAVILRERGLVVQDLTQVGSSSDEPTSIWQMDLGGDIHTKKIKPKKLLMVMNQMGMMMKAGINLSLSMQIMIDSEKDISMRKILREINENLYSGFTLSQAMRNFAGFPPIYISIIEAGEANGRLDESFEQCALICKKDIALSGKGAIYNISTHKIGIVRIFKRNTAIYINQQISFVMLSIQITIAIINNNLWMSFRC